MYFECNKNEFFYNNMKNEYFNYVKEKNEKRNYKILFDNIDRKFENLLHKKVEISYKSLIL